MLTNRAAFLSFWRCKNLLHQVVWSILGMSERRDTHSLRAESGSASGRFLKQDSNKVALLEAFWFFTRDDAVINLDGAFGPEVDAAPRSAPLMSGKSNFNSSESLWKRALVDTCPLNHEAVGFKPLGLSSFWKNVTPPQSHKHSSAGQKHWASDGWDVCFYLLRDSHDRQTRLILRATRTLHHHVSK